MSAQDTLRGHIVALLALLAAGMLAWFGAVSPYIVALTRSGLQLEAATAQLQTLRLRAARESAVAGDAGIATSLAAQLMPGTSPAAAAAYLQQRLGALVTESGALLLSFELLPAETSDDAPLQGVTGRIRVTGNTPSLLALLYALESQRPLLVLDNIFVRARSDQDTVPGGHLDVQMDVSGYRQAVQ